MISIQQSRYFFYILIWKLCSYRIEIIKIRASRSTNMDTNARALTHTHTHTHTHVRAHTHTHTHTHTYIYIYVYICYNNDISLARISLNPSLHPSLSFIAPGRSSRLYPVSAQSCCILVLTGRPKFSRPQEYIAYEFVLTSPAVSCMSGSSNEDSFRDGW